MEFIDETDFSDQQKEIVQMRLAGSSLTDIIKQFNTKHAAEKGNLTKQALMHCLLRSVEAYRWEKGMKGGNYRYLSKPDFEKLKEQIVQRLKLKTFFPFLNFKMQLILPLGMDLNEKGFG